MTGQTRDVNRNLVLAAMCLALATVVSTVSSLNVALPDVARDLQATQTQLQWIIDAYAVVFAGLLLLAGAIGDAVGRKHVLLTGLVVFSIAAGVVRLDVTGGVISAAGLTALVYGIIEGPERGWTDSVTLGAFAVAVVLLTAFVVWELRREQPLLDPRLFLLRGFGAGTASITVQFLAFFGFIFVILQYVQFVLGYSPLGAGVALAPMAVVVMAISPRVPRLLGRFGPAHVAPA